MSTVGTRGTFNIWRTITLEELAKHKDFNNDDAWMAIKGVVYNVSSFAEMHPGGAEKIIKYAGRDGTDTFNMVHPYVDVEAALGGLQVAVLTNGPEAPKRPFFQRCSCFGFSCFGGKYRPPTTYFKQDSVIGTYHIEFQHPSLESDWSVAIINKKILQVYKCVDKNKGWLSSYELPERVLEDRIVLDFKDNYEHAEITLWKPLPTTTWSNQSRGLRECGKYVRIQEGHSKFDAFIVYKKCLTSTSSNLILFGIQVVKSARIGVPVGLHVNIYINDVVRPYTPVCFCLVEQGDANEILPADGSTVLYFIIKVYRNGKLTKLLDAIKPDAGYEIPTLQVSMPCGSFDRTFLDDFSLLLLISGGSGITPMIKIVKSFLAKKNIFDGRRVAFIYFCAHDDDLVWKKQFLQLQNATTWFHYFPVLTQPTAKCHWKGLTGRINPELVQYCISKVSQDKKGPMKAFICGPPPLNSSSVDSLAGIVLRENIIVFAN